MKLLKVYLLAVVPIVLLHASGFAQSSTSPSGFDQLASSKDVDAFISSIRRKYSKMTKSLEKDSKRLLQKVHRSEQRLAQKMAEGDSSVITQNMKTSNAEYNLYLRLISDSCVELKPKKRPDYIPNLDTIQSAIRFLTQKGQKLSSETMARLQSASGQLAILQDRFENVNAVTDFIKSREALLNSITNKISVSTQLSDINKDLFYFGQRVNEYKSLINDRKKIEEKLISSLRNIPAFSKFIKENGYLSAFLGNDFAQASNRIGSELQTRADVQRLVADRSTTPTAGASEGLNSQLESAQAQLNVLKDKLNKAGGMQNGEEIPGFKPNSQKTKNVWERLEFGFNIQSARTTSILPATMDWGLSVGYKINDRSVIGIGASYKLGLGKPVGHIEISNQGVGIRSFIEAKLKGRVWLTGGYEYNYFHSLNSINTVSNVQVWQPGGLIGLTKKIRAGRKDIRLQLLWDFLSYQQVPRSQAIKFRIGYSL